VILDNTWHIALVDRIKSTWATGVHRPCDPGEGESMSPNILCLTLLLALVTLDRAWAQEDSSLQEIVVTAEKRQENLTQVPISISVVTPATLQNTNSKDLTELEGVVPGVTFQGDRSYGGVNIAMRGTSGSTIPLQDDPVAVYVDGVYVPNDYFGVSGLTDIGSMEIVRGPQGTLQGRNATAGAILVNTADPSDTAGGYVDAYGAYPAQYRAQSAFTGPIADGLTGRIAVDQFGDRGWAKNNYNGDYLGGSESTTVRGVLLWLQDPLRIRFSAQFERYTAHEDLASWATNNISPTGEALPNPTPGTPLPLAEQQALENGHFYQDIPTGYTTNSAYAALQINYQLGFAELVSITGANRFGTDGITDSTGLAILPRGGFNTGTITNNFASEELRLQSVGDGPLRWLVGAYASVADGYFNFNINNLTFTLPIDSVAIFNSHQRNPSAAAFTDVTYRFLPEFAITGGVRYTSESKTFRNDFTDNLLPSGPTLAGPLYFTPPKKTWDDTNYRGQLDYYPNQDSLVYVSHSTGFKSGGFNSFTVGTSQPFNPETLASTEVGAKADLWDRRVHVATAIYYNKYDNLQVSVGVPTGGVQTENAASAIIRGFEFEGAARVTDHLTLEANAAYTDGYYKNFNNAEDIYGDFVDASGNRLISTPLWQYFAQGSYDFPLAGDWSGVGQLNWRWREKLFFEPTNQNLANFQSPSDGELGARLRFDESANQLWVAVYGENLTDTRRINSLALAFNNPLVSFNRPRTIGIEINKKF
jgi:iron complex outermembrane recepter protein